MNDHNRQSNINGSMNSMYYLQSNKLNQPRFIAISGHYLKDKINESIQFSRQQNFNTLIQISSFTAWGLLLINSLFSAFVPCWLMWDVKSQSFTRNSWRFFTVSVLFLPFLMYEQRNIKTQNAKFFNTLTRQNLKPIFVSTFNFCLWLLCLIYACKFTSMNHAVFLSSLRFYLISFIKIKNNQKFHQFEIAGTLLCTLGTLMCLVDSLTFPQMPESPERYKRVQPWKRVLFGDSLALIGSVASVYLDQNYKVPEMPKFSYLFLYNLFLGFNLVTFGYFFGGNEFSFNPKFGVWGLFTYQNFVSVFYVSVLLGLYLMVFNILIAQIFNDVMINVAACFQLTISALYWHVLSLQPLPSGLTCLGYAFIIPGLIFTIGGQGALNNTQNQINFQLYRPTQIRNTVITQSPIVKLHSYSMQGQKNFHTSILLKEKTFDNMPFEMILQEDENQNKGHKHQ